MIKGFNLTEYLHAIEVLGTGSLKKQQTHKILKKLMGDILMRF